MQTLEGYIQTRSDLFAFSIAALSQKMKRVSDFDLDLSLETV